MTFGALRSALRCRGVSGSLSVSPEQTAASVDCASSSTAARHSATARFRKRLCHCAGDDRSTFGSRHHFSRILR